MPRISGLALYGSISKAHLAHSGKEQQAAAEEAPAAAVAVVSVRRGGFPETVPPIIYREQISILLDDVWYPHAADHVVVAELAESTLPDVRGQAIDRLHGHASAMVLWCDRVMPSAFDVLISPWHRIIYADFSTVTRCMDYMEPGQWRLRMVQIAEKLLGI